MVGHKRPKPESLQEALAVIDDLSDRLDGQEKITARLVSIVDQLSGGWKMLLILGSIFSFFAFLWATLFSGLFGRHG